MEIRFFELAIASSYLVRLEHEDTNEYTKYFVFRLTVKALSLLRQLEEQAKRDDSEEMSEERQLQIYLFMIKAVKLIGMF